VVRLAWGPGAPGLSRGYGFVHMSDPESAKTAAQGMSGKMLDGRPLVCRLRSEGAAARFKTDRQTAARLPTARLPPGVGRCGGLQM
jgi:RNA recognition motif-containing protein